MHKRRLLHSSIKEKCTCVNKHAWVNSYISISRAEQRGNEKYQHYETGLYGGGTTGAKEV